jgi:D-serine deaminase-like pyridoxal phosphate-dependent protein
LEARISSIGNNKSELETPALLIDLDLMNANIERMSAYFGGKHSTLRAHSKTHKSPYIAHKQISSGSRGVCVQKLGEAEVMVGSGVKDVLITNEVVDPRKLERLVALNNYADVKVAVDNLSVAKKISEIARIEGIKQGVLIEVDVRNRRCGRLPGRDTADFVKEIGNLSGIEFRGLMGYEGPFLDVTGFEARKSGASKLLGQLAETVEMVEKEGIHVEIVSAGSTGTYNIAGEYQGVTEVEAGSYVFMDSTYRKLDGLKFHCALTVLATVISRPIPERVIVDVGWKTIASELGPPEVKDVEGAKFYHQSEEHGLISVGSENRLSVGDKVELIPSHCCTTVNLHDNFYVTRKEKVEAIWPIAARGRSQ